MTTDAETTRKDYFAFLDKRIPQLQNHGKPENGSAKRPLADRIEEIQRNAAASAVPGRAARERADAEWGVLQRTGELPA